MPGRRNNCGFTLRTRCSKEVDRLMVCIGQSHRYNQMTGTNIESRMYQTGNVKLLKSNFSTLFHFCFILTVFWILKFCFNTYTSCFKFYFSTQYPLGIKLVVKSQHKTRNCNGIAVITVIDPTIETIRSVIHKLCYHLSVSTETELFVVVIFCYLFYSLFLCRSFRYLFCWGYFFGFISP